MSEDRRNRSVVRILSNDNIWRGVGFLTPDRHVMTCAHVVGDALLKRDLARNPDPPKESFKVQFPTSKDREPRIARVVPMPRRDYGWAPMDATKAIEDIAVLQIEGGPPADALPVALTSRKPPSLRRDFLAYGMPDRSAPKLYTEEVGAWPNGQFTDAVADGLLEVRALDEARGGFIKRGCSGAAAWSDELKAAVGMVSMADVNRDVALVKPVTHLRQIWPTLAQAVVDAGPQLTGGESTTLLTLIDRQPQEGPFSRELKAHFGEHADPARQYRPLLCVVRGHRREGHDYLRTRFKIKPLSERHVLNAEIQSLGIDWDCYGCSIADGMEILRYQLADKLKAQSDAPEAIAAAINLVPQPRFIYTTISHERFQAQDADLVGAWIQYLRAIGGTADQPRLTCECYVFLSFTYDPVEHGGTALARFCVEQLGGLLQGERCINLPPLGKIGVEHVPTWFDTLLDTIKSEDARRRASEKRAKNVAAVENLFPKGQTAMHMSELIDRANNLSLEL